MYRCNRSSKHTNLSIGSQLHPFVQLDDPGASPGGGSAGWSRAAIVHLATPGRPVLRWSEDGTLLAKSPRKGVGMSVGAQQLLTATDYWHLPDNGMQRALVRGEVVEAMPPGGRHGVIAAILSTLLHLWARSGPRGVVVVASGFVLGRNSDTVRGPDVFYIRQGEQVYCWGCQACRQGCQMC